MMHCTEGRFVVFSTGSVHTKLLTEKSFVRSKVAMSVTTSTFTHCYHATTEARPACKDERDLLLHMKLRFVVVVQEVIVSAAALDWRPQVSTDEAVLTPGALQHLARRSKDSSARTASGITPPDTL